jgi:hypothetical protein
MKDYRDQIKNLAFMVNDGLTAYIAVHDKIFKESATIKSLIRNLLGLATPASQLLRDAETLIPIWNEITQKIECFRRDAYSAIDEEERSYFEILNRYTEAVNETVSALVERQRLLSERSEGGRSNPVNWKVYQDAGRKYQSAVEKYTVIGQELNNASRMLF